MFTRSARYYDTIYAWKDYAAEAAAVHRVIRRANPKAATLLDVACGTGKHLEQLREHYQVTGTDLDPELLAVAAERLPGVELLAADMTELELGRTFDAITCLFSSLGYTRTVERLNHTVAVFARHLGRGGVLLVEPWFTPEQYDWSHVHAVFIDEPGLKIARVNNAGPRGDLSIIEFHYVIGTPQAVETFTERHEVGLFTHQQYLDSFAAAGLGVTHDPEGLMGRGLYVGVKP